MTWPCDCGCAQPSQAELDAAHHAEHSDSPDCPACEETTMTTPGLKPPRMTWTARLLIAVIVIAFIWLNYRVAVR